MRSKYQKSKTRYKKLKARKDTLEYKRSRAIKNSTIDKYNNQLARVKTRLKKAKSIKNRWKVSYKQRKNAHRTARTKDRIYYRKYRASRKKRKSTYADKMRKTHIVIPSGLRARHIARRNARSRRAKPVKKRLTVRLVKRKNKTRKRKLGSKKSKTLK